MATFIGNKEIVSFFEHSLSAGTIFHANLFIGPDGIGKRTLACEVAKGLLCDRKTIGGCETCRSCQSVGRGAHPDVYMIARDAEKKNISIEKIRDLRAQLGQSALMGGMKIAIIDGVDFLSLGAANALLKKLEEGAGIVFFLLAEAVDVIPETIRSRCFIFNFYGIMAGMHDSALGRPGLKQRFENDHVLRERVDTMRQRIDHMIAGNQEERLAVVSEFFGSSGFSEQQEKTIEILPHLEQGIRAHLRDNASSESAEGFLQLTADLRDDVTPRVAFERFTFTL